MVDCRIRICIESELKLKSDSDNFSRGTPVESRLTICGKIEDEDKKSDKVTDKVTEYFLTK